MVWYTISVLQTILKLANILTYLPTFVTRIPGRIPNFLWTLAKIPEHPKFFSQLGQNHNYNLLWKVVRLSRVFPERWIISKQHNSALATEFILLVYTYCLLVCTTASLQPRIDIVWIHCKFPTVSLREIRKRNV